MKNLIFAFISMVLLAIGFAPLVGIVESCAIVVSIQVILALVSHKLPKLAMFSCVGIITGNLGINCTNPVQGGTRDRMWIVNHKDWKSGTISTNLTNNLLIEGIVTPNVSFFLEGQDNSIKGTYNQLENNKFDHLVDAMGYDLSPESKKIIDGMNRGRYVVIVENNYAGNNGDSAFEVYGNDSGMKLLHSRSTTGDTEGAFALKFATPSEGKEGKMPKTIFLTSYAVSLGIVESTLVP